MRKNKILIFTTIILFSLGIINTEYFRPNFGDLKYINVIIGSLPNFVGGFLFVIFFNGLIPEKYWKKRTELIYLTTSLVFILLTKEEFYPFFAGSKTFDIFDIVASGLGVLFAFFLWKLSYLKNMRIKENV